MGDTAVADFFSNWSVYRAVIDNNCMEHREIYSALAPHLAERTQPFTVLDLGCGDAAGIAPVLAGLPLGHYVGVDCAAPALDFARDLLAPMSDRIDLQVADMMTYLQATDQTFDVILASFALHHFGTAAKQEFLEVARTRLRPGGQLVLIDVVRRDGESRDEYLERYWRLVRQWPVDDEKKAGIRAHVEGNDFPEPVSELPRMAAAAGFDQVTEFYRGGSDTQAAWIMSGGSGPDGHGC